jgi:hypothetical protein
MTKLHGGEGTRKKHLFILLTGFGILCFSVFSDKKYRLRAQSFETVDGLVLAIGAVSRTSSKKFT